LIFVRYPNFDDTNHLSEECIMLKRTRSNWQATNPDIVMFNGNIITVDNEFSLAEAIAIKGATIIGVCSSIDIRKLAGENTRQIDLQGVTVLSGLEAGC
jgi:adenine deaminase